MKIPGAIRTGVQSLGRHDTSAAGNVGGALAQAVGGLAKEADIWMRATRDSEEAEALADLKLRENQARTNHTSLLRDVPGTSMGKGTAGGSKIRADGTYRSYDVGTSMYGGVMDGHISETTKGLTFPQTKRFANAVRRLRTIGHDKVTAYHLKARHSALKTHDDLGVDKTIRGSNPDTIIEDAMIIAEVYERSAKNGVISIEEAAAKTLKAQQILHLNVAEREIMRIREAVINKEITPEAARNAYKDIASATKGSAVLTDKDEMSIRTKTMSARRETRTLEDRFEREDRDTNAFTKSDALFEQYPDAKDQSKRLAAVREIKDAKLREETKDKVVDRHKAESKAREEASEASFDAARNGATNLMNDGQPAGASRAKTYVRSQRLPIDDEIKLLSFIDKGGKIVDDDRTVAAAYALASQDEAAFLAENWHHSKYNNLIGYKTANALTNMQKDLRDGPAGARSAMTKQTDQMMRSMGWRFDRSAKQKANMTGDQRRANAVRMLVNERYDAMLKATKQKYLTPDQSRGLVHDALADFVTTRPAETWSLEFGEQREGLTMEDVETRAKDLGLNFDELLAGATKRGGKEPDADTMLRILEGHRG